jgi:hypothetical protein
VTQDWLNARPEHRRNRLPSGGRGCQQDFVHNAPEALQLRTDKYPDKDFAVWDPEGDEEGFLIVGNDRDELIVEAYRSQVLPFEEEIFGSPDLAPAPAPNP